MDGGMIGKPDAKYFPTIYLDSQTLPEGKDWKVGKTYDVTLRLTMKGISQRKGRDEKEHGNYDFDIVGIDPTGEVKDKKEIKRYA